MIIFFDTETCGLFPKGSHYTTHFNSYPHIVQLAYLVCDKEGKELDRYDAIVKPEGYDIPKEASDIHGITTEVAMKKGRSIKEVLKYFFVAVNKCDTLVAHNIFYDTSIIKASVLKLGLSLDLINTVLDTSKRVDTMMKTIKFCNLPGKYGPKWPKLEELYRKLFNKEIEDAHNAMGDVIATKDCYFELKNKGVL